ncbi:hypothetical protein SAMN04487983_101068 [Streptomyces sp. yr375]|uniref:hypothetical protein n=1 Tax=Streptomyces sp. yr375 TaxID=1761906 RepID=UPI0008C3F575|nr:hypothetical protein [Streptomyces sp. yr375]SEQ99734.1 hypothetical protein SAMN04487983_101068 [Streptomyces sp. yr375]
MDRRGQKFKFATVAVLVVLALTGFSTGRGHGHGSSHSGGDGGGGGCSNSSQDHDSSSSGGGGTSGSRYHDYDDDDDYDDDASGGSGSSDASAALQDASVTLVDCATPSQAYATVEVTNPNSTGGYFTVTVDFLDAGSNRVEEGSTDEYVAGNATATVQVDLSSPGVAAKVDHCNPEPYAPAT